MSHFTRRAALVLGGTALIAAGRRARAENEQQRLVDRARLALEEFLDDGNFARMRVYVQNAQAALLFPELLKAGLIVGVEAGAGMMLVRDQASGGWSNPAF